MAFEETQKVLAAEKESSKIFLNSWWEKELQEIETYMDEKKVSETEQIRVLSDFFIYF